MMAKNNGITLAYHDRPCVAKQKRTQRQSPLISMKYNKPIQKL